MIKSIINILILSFFFFACNKNNEEIVIKGELVNLESPFVIATYRLSDSIRVDTIEVDKKGRFSFVQHLDTNSIVTFYFNEFHSSTVVYLEDGLNKVKLKGDAILPNLIQVKGGEINDDLSLFKQENEILLRQRNLMVLKTGDDEVDSIQSLNLITEKEHIAHLNSLNHEIAQKVEDFIILNPKKISSVILINEFFKNDENPKNLDRVLDYLEGEALEYPLTENLKNYRDKLMLSAEGEPFPHFYLIDINKDELISNDFEDKYLLMSFLTSNGEKSKDNIRILKDEYSKLDNKKVEFLSIFIDSDTFPINIHEIDSIPWKIVTVDESWSSNIVEDYNVHYTPFNILIDPKGIIVSRDIPLSDVKNLIKKESDKSNL